MPLYQLVSMVGSLGEFDWSMQHRVVGASVVALEALARWPSSASRACSVLGVVGRASIAHSADMAGSCRGDRTAAVP